MSHMGRSWPGMAAMPWRRRARMRLCPPRTRANGQRTRSVPSNRIRPWHELVAGAMPVFAVRAGGEMAPGSVAAGIALPAPGVAAAARCWPGSVAEPGLAVFAAVVQEPQDAEAAAAAESEQRHLDGQEGSRFGPTGKRGS